MSLEYKNPALPVKRRVEDLLARMTTDEKIGQLIQPLGWKAVEKKGGVFGVSAPFRALLASGGAGSLYGMLRADPWTGVTLETGMSPREGAEALNAVQRAAVEESRLGIPLLFCGECCHGHMSIGATVFPAGLAMASMWDPALYRKICEASVSEARSQGITVSYSPTLDVCRDPRWGRAEETFGEDPWLCSRMAEAAAAGYQGAGVDTAGALVMTAKHFAAHGVPEGGHNAAPAHVGPRELREVFLRPFEAAVRQGALCVMTSYNEIDGVPCACNRRLLTDLLRGEWGFGGFVVSDCSALDMLWQDHRVAADAVDAAAMALTAGVDVDLPGATYGGGNLQKALEQGKISMEQLDLAVSRVLRVKFLLGLFEHPYSDSGRPQEILRSSAHKALAREAARRSMVLLKNRDGLLPLRKDIRSVAVVGPNADSMYAQLGDYTVQQRREDIATVLDGVRRAAAPGTEVRYAQGCGVRETSRRGFSAALEAARGSNAVIAVMGGSSARRFGGVDPKTGAAVASDGPDEMDCGEGFDRSELGLAGVQLDLLRELKATGVPLIVVLINGRPLSIPWVAENADAVLEAWYPGEAGGDAAADLLFGACSPSGKLPISFPESTGQLPVWYGAKTAARKPYADGSGSPLYGFGSGLSYTTFRYSNLRLFPARARIGDAVRVCVDVTNTGSRAGEEVAQLYLRDEVSSVTRPPRELKGFRRVGLAPGETKTVQFAVGPEELQFVGPDGRFRVEPGVFTVMAGGSPDEVLSAPLELME